MKSLFVLLIIITMANTSSAQNNADISGSYSLGSSNPEGGSHLFVFEDGSYAILYFGGMQVGQWKLTQENSYEFTPSNKGIFEIYGRHHNTLANETRISFNGFENGETYIHLGKAEGSSNTMKRVFNADANGFSYPYVHTFKAKADVVSFMYKDYMYDRNRILTFKNPEGYNDFIAFFAGQNHERESRVLLANFKDDRLRFERNESMQRVAFNKDDQEIEEIRAMAKQMISQEVLYLNPSYNHFEGLIDENHVFNEQKQAFIDEEYYQEGEENIMSEQSYDSMSIIYVFKAIRDFSIEAVKYKIDEDSIFKVKLD